MDLRYKYFGLIFGRNRKVCRLDSAQFPEEDGSHVAVWSGINSDKMHWVQGGVQMTAGTQSPDAYIEINKDGQHPHYEGWPVAFGDKVTVTLIKRPNGNWKLKVNFNGQSHVSDEVYIGRNNTTDAMLEILGHAKAIGHINGRKVQGNTIPK
jgi:hypothetical protein